MSMKRFNITFLLAVLLASPLLVVGQDLIVTKADDSLNVFITKEKSDYVYFIVESEGSGERVNSLLSRSDIKSMVRGYYSTSVVSPQMEKALTRSGLRVGLQGGYSRRLASNPDGLNEEGKNYYNSLKNGYTLSGDFTYYFNEKSGIGVTANLYRSEASTIGMIEDDNGNLQSAMLKEDVSVLYIAPFYSMRFYNWNYKNFGWMRFGAGYTKYKNDIQLIYPFKMSANTFGISIELGYDLGVSENFAFGFGIGLHSSVFSKVDFEYPDGTSETVKLETDETEGLGRLDLTLGIRFLQ